MTLFFKEGEAIALPGGLDGLDGASVSFSVYPIGVE